MPNFVPFFAEHIRSLVERCEGFVLPGVGGQNSCVTGMRDFAKVAAKMHLHPALTMMSLLLACGGGADATSFGGLTRPGITGATGGSEESSGGVPVEVGSSSSGDALTSTSSGSTTDGIVWDMGQPDFGSQEQVGCNGKIDFLFVISAFSSMYTSQQQLLASFPGFMDAIEAHYPGFDRHILVANPNVKPGWLMEDCSLCKDDCDPQGDPPFCGAQLTICDKTMGAGVTYPAGPGATNRRCDLDPERRYITSAQQDVAGAFACAAQVGMGGSDFVAQAMVEALRPLINDPDDEEACNRGFLRDDALLVVTLIADSADQVSKWTVDEWIASLRAAKHGDDDAFAVLVLTTDVDEGPDHLCPDPFINVKMRLRQLAEGVKHGYIGSICMPNFAPFFAEHIGSLIELCDQFVPPG
jgi:hypothetical protein